MKPIAEEIKTMLLQTAGKKPLWRLWSDIIEMYSIAMANSIMTIPQREERYKEIQKEYSPKEMENITKICSLIVTAYAINPRQDLLGSLYMELKLDSHWKGQFFTPYSIAELLANLEKPELKEDKVYIIADSCCGSGCNIIAKINQLKKFDINFQRNVLILAQDLDYTTALMCYVAISVLGCCAVVKIGNSLEEPLSTKEYKKGMFVPNMNLWYSPMFWVNRFKFL